MLSNYKWLFLLFHWGQLPINPKSLMIIYRMILSTAFASSICLLALWYGVAAFCFLIFYLGGIFSYAMLCRSLFSVIVCSNAYMLMNVSVSVNK